MKFRQHIRVYGYPDALKETLKISTFGMIDIEGIGVLNITSEEKTKKLETILSNKGIKCKTIKSPDRIRPRYLLRSGGINKAIRGRKYKGDILYTIEANDERELLDKRDAVLAELKILKVPYEDVCKWVCETAPKIPEKKMFKTKPPKESLNKALEEITHEQKQIKNTVEDLKDKIFEHDVKKLKKSSYEDTKVRYGVIH